MKAIITLLLACGLWAAPAWAQSKAGSPELTPYEQLRYGDSLWEVPREPYQSDYQLERRRANISQAPPAPGPAQPGRLESPLRTGPAKTDDTRAQQRFQSRKQWENEQRKISERSRSSVPSRQSKPAWKK